MELAGPRVAAGCGVDDPAAPGGERGWMGSRGGDGDGLTGDEVDVRVLLRPVSNRAEVSELVVQALDHLSNVGLRVAHEVHAELPAPVRNIAGILRRMQPR